MALRRAGQTGPLQRPLFPSLTFLSSFPPSLGLPAENLELAAWILARVGGLGAGGCPITRALHRCGGCPSLGCPHCLPWGLRIRVWSFGLFIWKLHSGQLGIHGFRCQQERQKPSEKPPTCPSNSGGRERQREREAEDSTWGCYSPLYCGQCSDHQERSHSSEGSSPLSRHERIKQRKHNNKYCSFLNLCSSSIACCKQCLIFVIFLIVRNNGQTGAESEHPCPPFGSRTEPPGGLARAPPGPCPRGAWFTTGMDIRQSCPASFGRPGVPSGRGPALMSGSHCRETRRKSTKISSSLVEVWV